MKTGRQERPVRRTIPAYTALILFAAAFGYVEASVVIYLRQIPHVFDSISPGTPYLINLKLIAFLDPGVPLFANSQVATVETVREAMTIIMLGTVSYLAGSSLRSKLGAFLISFAVWDICYYAWLRAVLGWPLSFLTPDVFFLIPVAWVGPVITPLVISSLLFLTGTKLFLKVEKRSS